MVPTSRSLNKKPILRWLSIGLVAMAILVLAAPYLSADFLASRVLHLLEESLQREVEIGSSGFTLLGGPGLILRQVVIHEDPHAGKEPFAYVNAVRAKFRVVTLLLGRLEFSELELRRPSLNLVQLQEGGWNVTSLFGGARSGVPPRLVIRNGRVNFTLHGIKQTFHIRSAEVEVNPPKVPGGVLEITFSGEPARTDRPGVGLGEFRGRATWGGSAPQQLWLDVRLSQGSLGELVALVRGADPGMHGLLDGRVTLRGPLDSLQLEGSVRLGQIRRWDQLPPYAEGGRLEMRGILNLAHQHLELHLHPGGQPAWEATATVDSLLKRPEWTVRIAARGLQLAPVVEVIRHLGMTLPEDWALDGVVSGDISCTREKSLSGEILLENVELKKGSQILARLGEGRVELAGLRARLHPVTIELGEAKLTAEADLDRGGGSFQLSLAASEAPLEIWDSEVGTLLALPRPELFRVLQGGFWTGTVRYRSSEKAKLWSGSLKLHNSRVQIPGLARPLELRQAQVELQGDRVTIKEFQGVLGETEVTGGYRFEPAAARPHRVEARLGNVEAGTAVALLHPTFQRPRSLLAMALRRARLPEWLPSRKVEGQLYVRSVKAAGEELESVRLSYYWEGPTIDIPWFTARVRKGQLTGHLNVDLGGKQPRITGSARMERLEWRGGRLTGDLEFSTEGFGPGLSRSFAGEGSFRAEGVILEAHPSPVSLWGNWSLEPGPGGHRLALAQLRMQRGLEVWFGEKGTTEEDQFRLVLSNGEHKLLLAGKLRPLVFHLQPLHE